MITAFTHVSLYVRDQDEALQFYTDKLGFRVREDDAAAMPGFRWLTVLPPGGEGPELVLYHVPPEDTERQAVVGRQMLGVLRTDDCRGDVEAMRARGVTVSREPEAVPWGIQAVVEDCYGNPLALVQPPQR